MSLENRVNQRHILSVNLCLLSEQTLNNRLAVRVTHTALVLELKVTSNPLNQFVENGLMFPDLL